MKKQFDFHWALRVRRFAVLLCLSSVRSTVFLGALLTPISVVRRALGSGTEIALSKKGVEMLTSQHMGQFDLLNFDTSKVEASEKITIFEAETRNQVLRAKRAPQRWVLQTTEARERNASRN